MKPSDLSGEELQKQFEMLQQQLIEDSVEKKDKKAKEKATLTKRSRNATLVIGSIDLVDFYNRFITPLAPIFKPITTKAGICPFHKDTDPSFHAHRVKRYYHCFGCGYTGDVINVYTQLYLNYYKQKIDEKEAIMHLANMYGLQLYPEEEFNTNMDIFETAREMLTGKNYTRDYTGAITLVDYSKMNKGIIQSNLPFNRKIQQLGELDIQLASFLMEGRE